MYHHSKELQYNARVSKPDPRFARLLQEQFGGGNGELKAAMQYFVQAFGVKNAYPDKYDMLMDIATEEFSHLEIVGATIQMLLTGVNGELKDAAESDDLNTKLLQGTATKESFIHDSMSNPNFFLTSGGTPTLTNSHGVPWCGSYVSANGDLTVDLRSNMGAESTAKITYEYLMKYTDDAYVKDTLMFLMTREVAHYQMFEAALASIPQNFPPGVLESDPRYSNKYFNLSNGIEIKGPWNEGKSPIMKEDWQFIKDPLAYVIETKGLTTLEPDGTKRTDASVEKHDADLSKLRSTEVKAATPKTDIKWSKYPEKE